MATRKSPVAAAKSVAAEPVAEVPAVAVPEPVKVPVFRDKAFVSRTLILDSGRAVPVARSRVSADDAELLAYLTEHEEFEPEPE